MSKKYNRVKIFKLILFMLIIAICIYATIYLFPIIKNIETPEERINLKNKITNSGIQGMATLFLLEISQIFLAILPGEPLEIFAGMCYGAIGGTIFILVSILIISTVIFYLVKKFGKNLVYEFCNKEKIDNIENSKKVLNWISSELPKEIYVSVMAQYFPTYKAKEDKYNINRKLTACEWKLIQDEIDKLGIENGFIQELGEHEEEYVPKWEV